MDSTDPDAERRSVAELLAKASANAGLPVALIGGQAINFWALPRYTEDFDLTVGASSGAIDALVKELAKHGYRIVREEDANAASGPAFLRLENASQLPPIDLISAKTEYQEIVIARAVGGGPEDLPVATPEDLIVLKLIANRSIDLRDIFTIAQAQPIDWEYVAHWANVWDLAEPLAKLKGEIASRESEQS